MSWKDQVGSAIATFRGVALKLARSAREGGRRVVVHEYPRKDGVYADDLGMKGRTFPVEGFVLGPDYISARDALLAALEQPGSGELVHPYHGTRRVAVDEYRVEETTDEGGVARFTIKFLETDAQAAQPTTVADTAGALATSASTAGDAVSDQFTAAYAPGDLLASVQAAFSAAATAVQAALAPLALADQDLAALNALVTGVIEDAADTVKTAEGVVGAVANLMQSFADGSAVSALLELYDFDPGPRPPATTPRRLAEQQAFDAFQALVQRMALVRASVLALTTTYASYDDAVTVRESLTDRIDDQSETADDALYPALQQMRSDITKAIPGDDSDLPRLVTYTPPFTVPSLVLAYQLYGDVDLEADLIARNDIANPAFVPGEVPLEVLSRG